MRIDINKHENEKAAAFLMAFGKTAERGIKRAIDRAVKGVRTDAVKAVKKEYNVKPSLIRKSFRIDKSGGILEATAIASGSKIPLIDFGARPKKPEGRKPKAGVSVKVKNTRKILKHSFIARMKKSGHVGLFQRRGKDRLPIDEKFSYAIAQMLDKPEIAKEIELNAQQRFSRSLNHEINYALQKAGAR
ncbi:MAG: hypothetical protein GY729_07015 [Desulfobacteraceae bacterium]|nr:hypothetical protein [Desulfobacteraceae bacterium]